MATILSPFFLNVTPEVRTTYVSLGKIMEDRPMQTTSIRGGWDTGDFGRIGFRNWNVSSLTDRRADVHRHFEYLYEFGATWEYGWEFTEGWIYTTDLTRSWSICRGYEVESANATYHWWQIIQSLENPYVVPFYHLRRMIWNSDVFYFRLGARRKFAVWKSLYVTPSVYVEGGNEKNFERMFGKNINGGDWGAGGACAMTFRLEAGWTFNEIFSVYAYVEQYDIVSSAGRETNAASSDICAHNDWTLGGVGIRMKF